MGRFVQWAQGWLSDFFGGGKGGDPAICGLDWELEIAPDDKHRMTFRSDIGVLGRVLKRLSQQNIGNRVWFDVFDSADGERFYDWRIDLDFEGTREEVSKAISDALQIKFKETISDGYGLKELVISHFIPHIKEWADWDAVPSIEGLVKNQRDPIEILLWISQAIYDYREEIEELNRESQWEIDDEKERADILESSNKILGNLVSGFAEDVHSLEKELSDSEQFEGLQKSELERFKNIADEKAKELRNQKEKDNKELRKQKEKHDKKIRELEKKIKRAKAQTLIKPKPEEEIQRLIYGHLKSLSNIDIHANAADVIYGFQDRDPIFDVLRQLNEGKDVPLKSARGADSWREVKKHINIGQSDMGRVYFTQQANGRRFVVIHLKKDDTEQKRFIEKLRDPNFRRPMSFD